MFYIGDRKYQSTIIIQAERMQALYIIFAYLTNFNIILLNFPCKGLSITCGPSQPICVHQPSHIYVCQFLHICVCQLLHTCGSLIGLDRWVPGEWTSAPLSSITTLHLHERRGEGGRGNHLKRGKSGSAIHTLISQVKSSVQHNPIYPKYPISKMVKQTLNMISGIQYIQLTLLLECVFLCQMNFAK